MSDCNHDCNSCSENCAERKPADMHVDTNEYSHVKKVIAVISGKGGVGKSMVSASLATLIRRKGLCTAILDADITGPSVPKMFGVTEKAVGDDRGILPALTKSGIEMMSVNLLLPNDSDPVIWRGPILAGTVKQFWTDVVWGDVDVMFLDCPPGTGDVPLTIFQSIPVDGIIVVTSPQDLVSMIVKKAVKMADMMNVPILGIVENMSYFECPDCGKRHSIYGESHVDEIAAEEGIGLVAKIPIEPSLAALCDEGRIEDLGTTYLDGVADAIAEMVKD